eukprot:821432-Alexandrium_andersonii.AAC.1
MDLLELHPKALDQMEAFLKDNPCSEKASDIRDAHVVVAKMRWALRQKFQNDEDSFENIYDAVFPDGSGSTIETAFENLVKVVFTVVSKHLLPDWIQIGS